MDRPRSRRRRGLRISALPPAHALAHAQFEPLEERRLMSGVTSGITPSAAVYRSIDGTGNNLANPEWGSTREQLLRESPAAYADGVSAPAGAERPSARAVSDAVAAAEEG